MNAKGILKSSAIYGFLNFLPLGSRLFLFPVFVNFLTPFDYGVLGLHASVSSLLTILIIGGLDAAFSRNYFDYEGDDLEVKKYLSTLLFVVFGIGVLLGVILYFLGPLLFKFVFSDDRYSFFPYGVYAYLFALGSAINAIILIYFRNKEQPVKYLIFTMSSFLLMILFETYTIFKIEATAENILLARVLGLFIPSIILWLSIAGKGIYFKPKFLLSSFKYAFPVFIYALLGFAYLQYDRILVSNLLSISQLAIYNAAITIASVLEIALQALDMAILPTIFRWYKSEDIEKVDRIFRYTGYFTMILISLILFSAPLFVTVFTPDFYNEATLLIPIFLIGYIFRFYLGVLNKSLYFHKKLSKIPLINLVAGFVLIGLNLLLIPRIGLFGAAISMAVSRFIMLPCVAWLNNKETNTRHNLGDINLFFVACISLLIVCALHPSMIQIEYATFFLSALLILIIPLYMIWKKKSMLKELFKSIVKNE